MDTKSQLARLGLFDAKVPRYTSYPTAPHFGSSVDSPLFKRWINDIAPNSAISLYVHVPFCRRLCWFCACRTQGTQSDSPVRAYLDVLKAELDLLAQHLPNGVTLSRLHWGGGTPTMLSPDMMRDLATKIASIAPLAKDAEFSVEIDPNEIDSARIEALVAAGMNRASIGVQDFDPEIQETIGRPQSYETTRATVEMLRAHGIDSLNADILYGLPHQTNTRMADSVQKLLSLSPDRVALYGYAHVPWMARRQNMIPSEALPTPEARLELFETAQQLFQWDGYKEIGIDHFACPEDGLSVAQALGKLRRNFQGYTDDRSDVLIGIGASSISRFPRGYAQNAAATSAHTAAIRAGRFSTSRGHSFSQDDHMRARMIEALMCDFRIDGDEIQRKFAISESDLKALFEHVAVRFPDMVTLSGSDFVIPTHAHPLTRVIARAFDAYDLSKAGHSAAI
ncbi:oxygen-independent coproporphyrinogen III oxidase [Epibacterium ulvae]|uniref:oxygen-independent coproporphyrinogen III oxidase n=1 Tax=Epibacterium ulvae TaxID=1156985 RepID=UPI001BFC6CC5|nr:oxygen-independent coproporphyrinogen III oxidase [Epibacterium ulvae]MBT8155342.1 oxygen-independent coproporphyrinogen III oxidase [Epibacterium ulvae]